MKSAKSVLCGSALVLLGFGLTSLAFAGGKPGKDQSGSTSKELDILFRLAGRWKVEEQYPAPEGESEGAKGKGDAILKKELAGTYLIGEYRSKSKEMGTDVEGHAVFTYDPDGGSEPYRYWWFDNYGNAYAFTGQFHNREKTLVFTREEIDAETNDSFTDRRTFKFKDPDTVVYTWEEGTGNKDYQLILTAIYTRKGKKSGVDKPKAAPKRQAIRGRL